MPIATDPLSLVFIACFLFGLLFLLVTALLGGLGHGHSSVGHGHSGGVGHLGQGAGAAHHAPVGGHGGHLHPSASSGAANAQGQGAATQQGAFQSLFAYVNPMSIVLFLLGFGFFGYIFHNAVGFAAQFALAFAAVGGIVIAVLLLLMLNRIFGDSEGSTVQDVSDRTGLLGKVSITIPEKGMGEIIYVSPGGMRQSVPARSVDGRRLERDQEIVVVNYQHGVAEVDTWERFLNEGEENFQLEAPVSATPASSTSHTEADELAKLRALLENAGEANTELVVQNDPQKEL